MEPSRGGLKLWAERRNRSPIDLKEAWKWLAISDKILIGKINRLGVPLEVEWFHSDKELFQHILDEIRFLEEETRDMSREAFLVDAKSQRAFARSIEITGFALMRNP